MTIKKEPSTPKELSAIIEVGEEEDPEIHDFAVKNNVTMLAFIGSYVPRRYSPTTRGYSVINIIDEFSVQQALTEVCRKTKNIRNKKLFLLVNSPGGSLASAFKTANAVRDTFSDITVFVPHIAASGGTLIALTGNKIVMGMMSQLSPLDVQIQNESGSPISVNSYFRAKSRLDDYFSKRSEKESPYTMQHMAESLDPVLFEEFTGIQEEGKIYVDTILEKAGYKKNEREKIIESLIFTLPTHGFVIQYPLALQIGLKVAQDNNYRDAWGIMRKWLSKYLVKESDKHFIRYSLPLKSKKQNSHSKKLKK